jgi:hypothetical protein
VALRDGLANNARKGLRRAFWRTTQTCCAASRSSRATTWKRSGRSRTCGSRSAAGNLRQTMVS